MVCTNDVVDAMRIVDLVVLVALTALVLSVLELVLLPEGVWVLGLPELFEAVGDVDLQVAGRFAPSLFGH